MILLPKKEKLIEEALERHIKAIRVNADVAWLAVLSDIHQGANNRDYFKWMVDVIMQIPNCYVVVGGDSTNSVTRNSKGNIRDEWAHGDEQILTLADDIKPLIDADRVIGIMGSGNHAARVVDEAFISPEMLLACMVGRRDLFLGEIALLYFNARKNCYVHGIVHQGAKRADYFDYMRCDVLWREHFHLNKVEPKLVIDHNRFTKKPVVRTTYEIWNGSYQGYPDYAKFKGYRPQALGSYIVEMSGVKEGRDIKVWSDVDLISAINKGYKFI